MKKPGLVEKNLTHTSIHCNFTNGKYLKRKSNWTCFKEFLKKIHEHLLTLGEDFDFHLECQLFVKWHIGVRYFNRGNFIS